MKRLAAVILCMLAVSVSSAKKAQPVLDWKTGILWQSPDPCNYYEGAFEKESFLIIGDDLVYHVSRGFFGHKPNVTEREPVQYAIAGGYFYLQDEDGRVFKLSIVKKELDPKAQERLKNGQRPCQP